MKRGWAVCITEISLPEIPLKAEEFDYPFLLRSLDTRVYWKVPGLGKRKEMLA
jgi:hypothetical protein